MSDLDIKHSILSKIILTDGKIFIVCYSCGCEPVIIGTRISVSLIVEMERAGHTVDEMVALYPHIKHAQVYDALSYYYGHKKEIDKTINENKEGYREKRRRVKIGENKALYR